METLFAAENTKPNKNNSSEPWTLPPKFKMYEALGAVADGNRLEIVTRNDDLVEAKLYSSSRNKFYTITYNPRTHQIISNDNATWFVGYLGYPAVSLLLQLKVIEFNTIILPWLADIPWKDLNQKNNNNFVKTQKHVDELVEERGGNRNVLLEEVDSIYEQLKNLNLFDLGKRQKPPIGY